MLKIGFGFALSLLASQVQAACSDVFQFGRPTVQLCIGDDCETAVMSRSCGNVVAVSENYEAGSVLWIFRHRFHTREEDADDAFAVLHDPLDPDDIPLPVVDGRPQRLLYAGVPLEPGKVQKASCVPESHASACDFINTVLDKLHAP